MSNAADRGPQAADRGIRVLYCAIDQEVPGTTGGSVHVTSVAEGLAALGCDVHVLVGAGEGSFPQGPVHWIAMRPPFGRKELRWARAGAVRAIAERLRPDVIIERYYNFGGEGMLAGRAVGAITVLEVNAPVIDYPGSAKARLDRALIVQPLRRWRERICALADVIVTPSTAILPTAVAKERILELEWGADTSRFRPGASGQVPFSRPAETVAIFAGAFRSWHGAVHLVRALRSLRARGRSDVGAVLAGDGPELPAVRREAEGTSGIIFTGAVPHDRMPACLAAADIGAAPFDLSAHRPLQLGFYWSPLKIFEYMASGLPVVAPATDRIPALVGHEREGLLYDTSNPEALALALERLTDRSLRSRLGASARARAERDYSWQAHCERILERVSMLARHDGGADRRETGT
jgi:glycosyltransferase involved in cell wall biosynthesis